MIELVEAVSVAKQLYPQLSRSTTVLKAVLRLVQDDGLGCKSGRGLRGDYAPDDVASLEGRRTHVLQALSALRMVDRP